MHGPMTGLLDLFEGNGPEPGALEPDVDRFDRGRAVLRTLRRMAGEGAGRRCRRRRPMARRGHGPGAALRGPAAGRRAGRRARHRSDTGGVAADVVPPDRARRWSLGPLRAARHPPPRPHRRRHPPRPTLERIAELSAGNPMYAIELARSAEARSDRLGSVTPPTLRGVLAGRLGDVPDDLLAILRTAAALGPAPIADLARPGDPGASTLIHDAVDDGLLVAAEDGTIRFAHPLLASVVLDGTNPLERRALHARLADGRRPRRQGPPPRPVLQRARRDRRRRAAPRPPSGPAVEVPPRWRPTSPTTACVSPRPMTSSATRRRWRRSPTAPRRASPRARWR